MPEKQQKQNESAKANSPTEGWYLRAIKCVKDKFQYEPCGNEKESPQDRLGRRMLFATAVMAIAAASSAVVSIFTYVTIDGQLEIMRGQLDEMKANRARDHTIITQRAQLAVAGIQIAPRKDGSREGQMVWKNVGPTNANYVRIVVNSEVRDSEPESFADLAEPVVLDTYIAGHNSITVDFPIAASDAAAIAAGKKLYVWGWSEFDDIWTETHRHRIDYCYRLMESGARLCGRNNRYSEIDYPEENGRRRPYYQPVTKAKDAGALPAR